MARLFLEFREHVEPNAWMSFSFTVYIFVMRFGICYNICFCLNFKNRNIQGYKMYVGLNWIMAGSEGGYVIYGSKGGYYVNNDLKLQFIKK